MGYKITKNGRRFFQELFVCVEQILQAHIDIHLFHSTFDI